MEVTVRKEDGCEAYYYISHPENDTIVLTERSMTLLKYVSS